MTASRRWNDRIGYSIYRYATPPSVKSRTNEAEGLWTLYETVKRMWKGCRPLITSLPAAAWIADYVSPSWEPTMKWEAPHWRHWGLAWSSTASHYANTHRQTIGNIVVYSSFSHQIEKFLYRFRSSWHRNDIKPTKHGRNDIRRLLSTIIPQSMISPECFVGLKPDLVSLSIWFICRFAIFSSVSIVSVLFWLSKVFSPINLLFPLHDAHFVFWVGLQSFFLFFSVSSLVLFRCLWSLFVQHLGRIPVDIYCFVKFCSKNFC